MKTKCQIIINNKIIIDNIIIADTFYERFKGLMFNKQDYKPGLFIKNCKSVHTCFMNYDIDVICLDENFNVIKIFFGLKPFKFIYPVKNAVHILELASNNNAEIKIGDNIKIKQNM